MTTTADPVTAADRPSLVTAPVRPDRPRWPFALDATITAAMAAFALWTLQYEAALAFDWAATPVVVVWIVLALPLSVVLGRRTYRQSVLEHRTWPLSDRAGAVGSGRRVATRQRAGVAVAAVAAAVLLAFGSGALFWVGWVIALLTLLAVAPWWKPRRAPLAPETARADAPGGHPGRFTELAMLLTSVVVAVAGMFAFRRSNDDAYYVNLSTWVAERGRFPLRDTMFSDQAFPTSYGGGFPISSIEGLMGALARLAGLPAGTMVYLVFAPVLGFVSIWTLGSLARAWSPRPLPVFGWALAFVLVGAGGSYRSYSVHMIWQGKSAAVAILIPLVWVLATRVSLSRNRLWVFLTGVVGVCFIGLTSTAAILGPVIAVSLALAAALLRNRRLLWAGLAFGLPSLLGGLAVAGLAQAVGGPKPLAPEPWLAIHRAYGAKPLLVVLTVVVLLLGPVVLRRSRAATLGWSSAVVSLVLLAPGVLALGNAATRSGPIEWRMLLGPPVPVLVGLCVTAGLRWCRHAGAARPGAPRAIRAVVPVVAAVGVLAFAGSPPWATHLHLSSRPVWRTHADALANVQALIAERPPRGETVLMPADEMVALSLTTVRWHGVAPRPFYVPSLIEPHNLAEARYVLVRLATGHRSADSPSQVRAALRVLHVGTVCLHGWDHSGQHIVRTAGFGPFRQVGTLRCAVRPASPPTAG